MPIKDPVKLKEYERARYLKNKISIKKRASDWYNDNRAHVLNQHAEKSEVLKEKCKDWRKENKPKVKAYKKKYEKENRESHLISKRRRVKSAIARLPDYYVANQIKQQTGISVEVIRNNPQLIINHREQIKVKRLIKAIKNGQKRN